MEDDKRGINEATDELASGLTDGDKAAAEMQTDAAPVAEDSNAKLKFELGAVRAENAELKDKSLRLIAEMENLRRRTERDKAEFAKYAISEFARDVIGVGDNIRRAIEAVPKESVAADPALGSLIEGIEVTERELLKALERYQVKRFDPLGEPFNPHLHEAMTKIDVPNVPADTVVQVIQAGYMIDERILRPAAVIVAKGSKASEAPEPSAAPGNEEPIPPGAMKVPSDAVSSSSSSETLQTRGSRPDVQQNVLGREFQAERRRQTAANPGGDERVAQFRRQRQAAADPAFGEPRPQNGQGLNKASALHKPVIGSGKE